MAPNSDVQAAAAAIRTQVQAAVQEFLSRFRDHLTLVIQTNPTAGIHEILSRPDVTAMLTDAVEQARDAAARGAESAARIANDTSSAYQLAIAHDINNLYDSAPIVLRQEAARAFNSIQQHHFEVGEDTPGTNPTFEAAQARATAVRHALSRQSSEYALRNGLSVNVAASRGHTESVTEEALRRSEAGEDIWLEWRSTRTPGVTCAWCWGLHGHRVRPGHEFPHPGQIGHRRAPRLYLDMLHGPPMHPNCRCWLVIVSEGGGPTTVAEEQPEEQFITSTSIAAMPEEHYHGLLGFLHAAMHELGQVLRRLLGG